jgi:LDH2 family malate/lactate/ureidoglycolate dehydrogenase
LVGAIDVCRFVPVEELRGRVGELLARWGALPPAQAGERVLYPGEPEMIRKQQRLRAGIPLPPALVTQLNEEANRLGWPGVTEEKQP